MRGDKAAFVAALVLSLLAGAVLAQKPAAQAPAPTQSPVFKSKVEVVQLDVSVLDKHRQPVRDLSQQDFTILEDGKPQPIVGFSAFDMDDDTPPATGWMRDVPPDVATNQTKEKRLVVLVMDDALIPQDPWMIQSSKKIAASIIDKLDPDDFTAVVFTGDNRKTQDFTNDKTKLRAALEGFNPGLAGYRFGGDTMGVDVDMKFYQSAIRTLMNIAEFLARAPGQRKMLFWVSPGVPMDIEGRYAAGPDRPISPDFRDLMQMSGELFRLAQRSNVTIYPIDPTGLGGMKAYLSMRVPERVAIGRSIADQDYLVSTAANTGGRTVLNINEFETGIQEVFDENKSYYLLAFEPLKSDDGKLRHLEVKVNRRDVEVRSRSSYYAPAPEKPSKNKAAVTPESAELAKAIGGVLPDGRLPMRVAAAPFAVPGQRLATVAVVLGVRQPVPAAAAKSRVTETTELLVSAYTPEGEPRGTQRHTARVVLRAGADGEAAYEVLGRIDLPAGRYRLRLAATNTTSAKSGSVFADVIVPDYSNVLFSASPVVLGATPGRASAPQGLLSPLLPFVPTAEREFARTNKVTSFLRLYQSGQKSVEATQLAIRIRDASDQIKATETRTVGVDRFAAVERPDVPAGPVPRGMSSGSQAPDRFANFALRTADIKYDVPTNTLSPGEYLLSFEATLGATTIRRDVRFAVR